MRSLASDAQFHIATALHRSRIGIRRLFLRFVAANAQARLHKARLEAELYRNHYRLRTKNDDEPPIVR